MDRKIRVFLVEDDPMVLSINCKFFQKLQEFVIVGTATTGEQAIEAILNTKIDLLLLDLFLPGINGLEIAKTIRQNDLSIDIIMITAASDSATVTQALRLGVVDYLIKPYNFSRFSEAMKKYSSRFYRLKTSTVDQNTLDKITKSETSQDQSIKGIDADTLNLVKNFFRKNKIEITSEELGVKLNISRVTARRYLEHLVSLGILSTKNEYHKVGRPEKMYFIYDKDEL
ncbi:MAG: response regulator [Clostridiaceae bacterium]